MIQRNLWHALVLVMFRVFCLLKMMGAEFFDFPLANLSTSWTNNPSPSKVDVNITYPYKASISPILYRGSSNGSQFMSGFYCQGSDNITANCFFGVLIFETISEDHPQLVWSANRDHPVHMNATLNFTKTGDLILKDTDGTFVWSTNTGGKNVISLNLTTMGNIMLHSGDETSVWQSFDHLTDTLLPGQKLSLGQSITSSTSLYNFSRGSFSLVFESDNFLSAYTESSPPQSYMTVDPSELVREDQYLRYDNGTLRYKKALPSTTAEFMRLDADGYLKIYSWDGIDWKAAADVLHQYIDECGYPLVCGKYGICSSGSPLMCSCPDEANSQTRSFRPINSRQPNLGCTSSIPISCSNPISHTLLQLKNTSYFSIDKYGLMKFTSKGKIKLEDCKNSCLRDCSCKAAFFVENIFAYYSGVLSYNGCLLVNEVFSLKNIDEYDNEYEYDGVQAFLKVEEAPNKLNSSTITSPRKRSNGMQIVVGSSVGAFLGAILLLAFFYFLLRNKNEIEELDEISFDHVPGMPTRFSYNDLKATTNNFFSKLGQGGFGTVFEGTLSDGTTVAVKRLDGLGHVKKSFLAEVESIGSIHHVNLVRLIGFCAEKSHRLLVYEYMPKGSLDNWIFQKNKELSLDWGPRKKIILDIAKGLAYLHEECRCKILHLDIKPQNILLDENYNAKVSDFGLAKLIDKDQSEVMTHLRGTPGYLAPEWLSSIITEKVDVYSFGIVVLEILCGRKNLDRSQPEEDMHLLTLFKRKVEEERMEDLADTCNENMQSHIAEIVKMMKIAKWCLQSDYSLRPSMSIVVRYIEDSIDVESILGHEFTNLTISTTIAPSANPENAFGCVTLLPPISLSGPR